MYIRFLIKIIVVVLLFSFGCFITTANAQIISTYAGNGLDGFGNNGNPNYSGDNGLAINAQLYPLFTAIDSKGNIYLSQGAAFYTVRKIDRKTGVITTVAGNAQRGYSGDGGPATSARLNEPRGIAFDSHDNLYIADYWNNCIRRVDAVSGIITTVSGNGNVLNGYTGNGGLAKDALLFEPFDIAFDKSDNLYLTDFNNNCIRRIDATTGIITKVAGSDPPGYAGFSGDGGLAVNARLYAPAGIAINKNGDIIFIDYVNNRIRKIDIKTGIITTVAGNGQQGFNGNGGPAINAQIYAPWSISLDVAGNMYVCGGANNQSDYQVRKIDVSSGIISVFAGNGNREYSGDGGPPLDAGMTPLGVVFDNDGNAFIADVGNFRIREITMPPLPIPQISYTNTCALHATSFKISAPYLIDSATWRFDNSGNLSKQLSPEYTFTAAGSYTVNLIVYSGGKSVQATALVNITDCGSSGGAEPSSGDILIPNVFTPNADGINDEFKLIFSSVPISYNIHIFNRYGQLVFFSRDIYQNWKGDYNNSNCPAGIYYFVMKYVDINMSEKIRSGNITLLR